MDLAFIADRALTIFMFDFGRYAIAAGLLFACTSLLMKSDWRSRKIQARRAAAADYRREIFTSIRTVLVFVFVSFGTLWAYMNGHMARFEGSASAPEILAYIAVLILMHDTYFYWTHRAMHHRRLFRHFHRTHHRSITPTPFTAYAFDVPEAFVMALFMPIWLFLVPTPELAIFVFLAVMIVRNVMGHAGVELHARGWARHPMLKYISTTLHHDLHHRGSFHHNYGFYFTFWDRLMGTMHPDYETRYEEVTAVPAREDVPRLSGRLVAGAFFATILAAAALLPLVTGL